MAIIYTYPDLGAVDGSEKLLVTDGTDENNTKTVTTAAYGAYINATYGGGSGSNIYKADGSIIANRQLSGSSLYSLTFTNLTQFTVNTIAAGDIRLNPGTGGGVVIDGGDLTFTDGNGIKNSTNPTTSKLYWNNDLFVDSTRAINFTCNNANGFTQFTHGTNGLMSIVNGLVVLSGVNNDISDITLGANKTLTTKEWVSDYVANFIGSTNITTLGTITTGTWNADTISELYGGTGQSSYSTGDMLYATAANTLGKRSIGSAGEVLTVSGGLPVWQALSVNNSNWSGTDLAIANGGTGQSTAQDAINALTQVSAALNEEVLTKDTATGDAIWKTAASASNIYTSSGIIGSSRVATITDTLAFTGGSIRRNVNSIKIVEVTQESDFGTISGGNINLAANTTFVIKGEVTCSNTLTANGDGIAIVGLNRNIDKLTYTGTGNFINITDYDFTLKDVWLSSTTTGSLLINASNIAASGFANGRSKVLEIVNCQFRNCFNVMDVNGFDLVDISNTLFFYVQAPTIGCRFRDTSKLEFSSCEMIRWYDETNNALATWDIGIAYSIGDKVFYSGSFYEALTNNIGQQPDISPADWSATGYARCPMIELQANNLASFGAVNINGCIIHPQQRQDGIDIDPSSTTGFGTISSNAFVNTGLTTGEVFLPEVSGLPDYSQTATYNYDVFANQGILNSTSGCVSTLTTNATTTSVTGTAYSDVDTGGGTANQASVRFTVGTNGVLTYNGTKQVYCSIHASVALDSGGNDNTYTVGLEKDSGSGFTLLPGSESNIQFDSAGGLSLDVGTIPINYGTLFNQGDQVKLVVKKASGAGTVAITITDYQLIIRE